MGFGEVSLRPLRGMVGVGVVEADDVQAEAARLALNFDQFLGRDVVAIMGAVGAGVAGADDLMHVVAIGGCLAEQCAAALVREGLFAVGTDRFVVGVGEFEHGD